VQRDGNADQYRRMDLQAQASMTVFRCHMRRSSRSGFSLTEIAIVMAMAGLILAAVWLVYTHMYTSNASRQAFRQIVSIAETIRTLYADTAGIDDLAPATLTPRLDRMGAFPADMRYVSGGQTYIRHSWAGFAANNAVDVSAIDCPGTTTTLPYKPCFTLNYRDLPQDACTQLATMSLGSQFSGLEQLEVNGTAVSLTGGMQAASNACVDGNNTLAWTLSIRGN
jgi:prepilin-type N-terminal cleavage/methylation domain-containing protein